MANITVTSAVYWGGPEYNWSGLARGETVTLQSNLTVDPSVYFPTNLDVGANIQAILNTSKLTILNSSNTSAIKYYGNYQAAMRIEAGSQLVVSGGYINFYTGTGLRDQSTLNWLNTGYVKEDEPGALEVETSAGSGVYEPWLNISTLVLSANFGVGELGKWFKYDNTNGNILFGDGGKKEFLSSNSLSGTNVLNVYSSSAFLVGDYIHIIENETNRETAVIISLSGNTITTSGFFQTNLLNSYNANSGYIRLTKGGNIIPSGSNVRTFNVSIGTKNASGPVYGATNSDNYDTDLSPGGSVIVDKCNFFGFYLSTSTAALINLKNVAALITIFLQRCQGAYLENVYIGCDRYTTTETGGITTADSSRHIFNNVFIARKYQTCFSMTNTHYSNLSGCNGYVVNRTGNARYSFNFDTVIGVNCFNLTSIGFAVFGGDIAVDGLSVSDSPFGYHFGSNYTYLITATHRSVTFNNISVLKDGSTTNSNTFGIGGSLIKNSTIYNNAAYAWETSPGLKMSLINCDIYSKNANGFPFLESNLTQSIDLKNVTFFNFSMKPWAQVGFNSIYKQVQSNTKLVDSAGYGTDSHFYEINTTNTSGVIGILFQPQNIFTDKYTVSNVNDVSFSNNGNFFISVNNGWIEYTWPHWILGVTGFPEGGSVNLNGTNTGNFTYEFKINTGSGYTSAWETLNHTNLSVYNTFIDPGNGFKLKIKISKTNGNFTDFINRLNIDTNVNYSLYPYSEDEVNITLQNIVDGSEYYIFNQTTNKVVAEGTYTGSEDLIITNIPYNGVNETLLIRVRKSSASPKYIPFETNATLNENGSTIWISQVQDLLLS